MVVSFPNGMSDLYTYLTREFLMRRFFFFCLILISIIFVSCIPDDEKSVKELEYKVPTIIDDSLDIGLFSPFEVPLVQEREYEFTATTSYNYVRVHFVIPSKKDKWVSLRKLESQIFSQNLMIPKGTERVELGISNKINAKNSNDVKIYAVYNVIELNEFKDFILNEEKRRETEGRSVEKQNKKLESYQEIVIDHKYRSKYPAPLERGQIYHFKISSFDSSYCIFNTVNKECFSWLPIERKTKDGKRSEYFETSFQIPSDADEFRIALSSTSTTFVESLVSFNLVGNIDESKKSRLEQGEKIVISSSSMSSLGIPVDDEKIYKLSVDSFGDEDDYKYCIVDCNDSNGENLDFCILDKVDNRYETNCFYVPNGTEKINVYLSNEYFFPQNKIAQINVDDIKIETPLKAGKNIKKIDSYKSKEPDKKLKEFLESKDAFRKRKFDKIDDRDCKEIDNLVDDVCKYIEKNGTDNFQKMKLLHDAIWYLASYDWDSLNIGDYKPWDFRTVLSRHLCVCAGFSRTFVYFCDRMGLRAINVLGTGLSGNENTSEEVEKQNHAWTLVELDDGWYLMDLTWDCSTCQNGVRDDKYSCDYLIVSPSEFVKSHFPKNPEKQLLENPYNSTEMLDLLSK